MAIRSKISKWFNDNKKILIAVGCTAVAVGGGVWLIKQKKITELSDYVEVLDEISWDQLDRIIDLECTVSELEDLCLAKDEHIAELASELLRQGNSLGGQLMAERKAFLSAAA